VRCEGSLLSRKAYTHEAILNGRLKTLQCSRRLCVSAQSDPQHPHALRRRKASQPTRLEPKGPNRRSRRPEQAGDRLNLGLLNVPQKSQCQMDPFRIDPTEAPQLGRLSFEFCLQVAYVTLQFSRKLNRNKCPQHKSTVSLTQPQVFLRDS